MTYLDRSSRRIEEGDSVTLAFQPSIVYTVARLYAANQRGYALVEAHSAGIRQRSAVRHCGVLTVCAQDGRPVGNPAGPDGRPMAGTLLGCGCHLRATDRQTVLCATHLAAETG